MRYVVRFSMLIVHTPSGLAARYGPRRRRPPPIRLDRATSAGPRTEPMGPGPVRPGFLLRRKSHVPLLQSPHPSGACKPQADGEGHRGSESLDPTSARLRARTRRPTCSRCSRTRSAMRAAWVHIRTGMNGYRSAASRLSRASRMVSMMAHFLPSYSRSGAMRSESSPRSVEYDRMAGYKVCAGSPNGSQIPDQRRRGGASPPPCRVLTVQRSPAPG